MIIAADLFCGAGGTTTGLARAAARLGVPLDLTAVNHWGTAIETHAANHPTTRHLCARIDQLRPEEVIPGGRLHLLLASPECTHHSVARGGKPCNDQSRAQPWLITDWASRLYIDRIRIENVPEFLEWGPLGADGKPLKSKKGQLFRAWVQALEAMGYRVEWRMMCAADYGDPTTRQRLILKAARGRARITWPEMTHAEDPGLFQLKPWRTAREIIDWSIPGKSIFTRKKPLCDSTMARIWAGVRKFGGAVVAWDHQSGTGVWGLDQPLSTVTTKQRHGVVQPYLIQLRGTSAQQLEGSARCLNAPIPTLTTGQHIGLCQPFILSAQSEGAPRSVAAPVPTLTTTTKPMLVEPYLINYYGTGGPRSIHAPLDTVTTKDRFGLCLPQVVVNGERCLLDIHFRMLTPRELARAMGFPDEYHFAGTKTDIVKQIGNAVPVGLAEALALDELERGAA